MNEKITTEDVKKAVRQALSGLGIETTTARISGGRVSTEKKSARMTIALGCDHGGFELKEGLRTFLQKHGHSVIDCGAKTKDPTDYPGIAEQVAVMVGGGQCDRGIMIDGAGIGSCIVANKVPGVRAAMCYDLSTAKNSRQHNDSNVLTLGGRLLGAGLAEEIVRIWLETDCVEERHLRRVSQIGEVEKKYLSGSMPGSPPEGQRMDVDALAAQIAERIESRITPEDLGRAIGSACDPCHGCGQCVEKRGDEVRRIMEMGAGRISASPGLGQIPEQLARFIDHTLLKPEATREQIAQLCQEARLYQFASVCVNPTWVRTCRHLLLNSPVKVCSVVGFPLGASTPEAKAFEARQAIREGAKEIDMVINIGAMKSGDEELVRRDVSAVAEACRDGSALCKVIIEAALLTDEEKTRVCQLAKQAKADFVKTSTGFGPGGATAHDVALMKEAVRCQLEVKAAGGIRTLADAKKMIEAGATRIGASAGVKIVQEAEELVACAER